MVRPSVITFVSFSNEMTKISASKWRTEAPALAEHGIRYGNAPTPQQSRGMMRAYNRLEI